MTYNNEKKEGFVEKIITGIAISIGGVAVTNIAKLVVNSNLSVIDISEWEYVYNNINKMIFNLNPKTYNKHRMPSGNKEHYQLNCDISYFIKLNDKEYIKVETYKNDKKTTFYNEQHLKISFFGKNKYKNRNEFLQQSLKLSDEKHIKVKHLDKNIINLDIIPHTFDNIILNKKVKNNIINGLQSWNDSKDWYDKNQLVHKIGVFLYGKAGTGKSTIAKAISNMFGNAPILTINQKDIMGSIKEIVKVRQSYDGKIIVLIEDFDMFFKSREEIENIELAIDQKKSKEENQNALFQLLDGIYSTDDTIYIATTNYKDRIDPALIRYGRFDIQEKVDFFNKSEAIKFIKLLGYSEKVLNSFNLEYPVQPSFLQSKVMEYRANNIKKEVK